MTHVQEGAVIACGNDESKRERETKREGGKEIRGFMSRFNEGQEL